MKNIRQKQNSSAVASLKTLVLSLSMGAASLALTTPLAHGALTGSGVPRLDEDLFVAIQDSDRAGVQALIRARADVNARGKLNVTPLHWATMWGDSAIAKLLIFLKADVNARSSDGNTPLDDALQAGDETIIG